MKQFFKKLFKFVASKGMITAFSFFVQVALIVLVVADLGRRWIWLFAVFYGLGIIVSFYIVSRDINPSYKISWTLLILMLPIFGAMLYLFIGRQHIARRIRKKMYISSSMEQVLLNETVANKMAGDVADNPTGRGVADYILRSSSFPVYDNTLTKYFPLGDDFEEPFIADLKAAKKFIFLEYFIIETGQLWDRIEAVLLDRVAAGVEVKIIYDDFGCLITLPKRRINNLRNAGIKILPFNHITFSFDMRFNNRSHRKIAVIDGEIAYTGGLNLADEYVNKEVKFGHWKDTAMRFEGDAVWSFTVMFLSFWLIVSDEVILYTEYVPEFDKVSTAGYVQPLTSGPGGRIEQVIENSMIHMINSAKRYIYINTPYLILDNEMVTALCNCARTGVDVRILVPHIPDKKLVFIMTRSFYPKLIQEGVRIYEYTPGFVHAKSIVCDDNIAFIGSCNLDYRSFYLHHEVGAILYDTPTVPEMARDFLDTLKVSHEVTYEETFEVSIFLRVARTFMRVLAPLM